MDNKKNILFVCHTKHRLGGAIYSLLYLLDSLDSSFHPIILTLGGEVGDIFKKKGYECIVFSFKLNLASNNRFWSFVSYLPRKIWDSFVNFMCVIYVKHKLNGREVQIVHSNSSVFTLGYDIAKALKCKHVWHIREFQDLDFNMRPFNGWDDLHDKIWGSDYAIGITRSIFQHWELNKCKNSTVLYNAVRKTSEAIMNENKENYVLFCSSKLSDGKGADVAVEIFCLSELAKDGFALKLVGHYEEGYKNKLLYIAGKYHLSKSLEFLGFQKDIRSLMSKASAFLMCSENEAMGRVTVEAMFYGCPIVGHRTGGTSEVVRDGIDGYLYDEKEDGANKLKQIISNKQKTIEMVFNAQKRAVDIFSVESYSEKINKIYTELTNEKI